MSLRLSDLTEAPQIDLSEIVELAAIYNLETNGDTVAIYISPSESESDELGSQDLDFDEVSVLHPDRPSEESTAPLPEAEQQLEADPISLSPDDMKKTFKRVKARLSRRGRPSGHSRPSALASQVHRAEAYPTAERPEVSASTPHIAYAMKFFWQLATKDSGVLRNALPRDPYCILRTRRPKNGKIHPDHTNAERGLLTEEDKTLLLSRLEGIPDSDTLTPEEYTVGTISELDRWMAFILEWQQKLEAVQNGEDTVYDILVGMAENRPTIRLPMPMFALRGASTDSYFFAHRNLYSSIVWRLSWRGLAIECSGEESALGEPSMLKHACPELHWEWYDMDSIVILPGKLRFTTGVGAHKQLPLSLEQPTKNPGYLPATTQVAGHLDDLHQQIHYWYTHMDEKFSFEIEIPQALRTLVINMITSVELLHYFELFHCGTEPGPVQRWVEPS